MQGSLQPTHSLDNRKMKPKLCISNWANCNQTVQYNTHYTNSQQFETVLNYRIIATGYMQWEKFASCFRWSIHQWRGKYIVNKYICPRAVCHNGKKIHDMFKMRKILWSCIYVVRFQQNHLNKFRYPYIQYVFCLILPMDVNNSTEKIPDYTDFILLQNLWTYLNISMLEYPIETSFYNWYYISELSNLTSLPSQC